jgi:hypothetical protein
LERRENKIANPEKGTEVECKLKKGNECHLRSVVVLKWPNDSRNWAAVKDSDFNFRAVERSGSRHFSIAFVAQPVVPNCITALYSSRASAVISA